jgi:transcriptional regulator with XRE-family HTH domain
LVIDIKKLRELRKCKDFTQEEVAKKSGIAANYFSQIETGKCTPALDTTLAIAKALEVTVNDLLLDAGANPPQPPVASPEAEPGAETKEPAA